MSTKIKDLKVGESAEIVGYDSKNQGYRSRLLAMGLTKGAVIKLLKLAPLGDPVEVEVRGFNLSLRKAEADVLQISKVSQKTEVK